MIDPIVGWALVAASAAYLAVKVTRAWRATGPSGVAQALARPSGPAAPDTTLTVASDGPWTAEDLAALRHLLSAYYGAQATAAYRSVLAQIAADEAGEGIDAVEDAANERGAA